MLTKFLKIFLYTFQSFPATLLASSQPYTFIDNTTVKIQSTASIYYPFIEKRILPPFKRESSFDYFVLLNYIFGTIYVMCVSYEVYMYNTVTTLTDVGYYTPHIYLIYITCCLFFDRRFVLVSYFIGLVLYDYNIALLHNLNDFINPLDCLLVAPFITILALVFFRSFPAFCENMLSNASFHRQDIIMYIKALMVSFMFIYGMVFVMTVIISFYKFKCFNYYWGYFMNIDNFIRYTFVSLAQTPFNCLFVLDSLSYLFMGLTTLLIFLSFVFLWPTFATDKNIVLYLSQLLLLLVQLQITFTTVDILVFFLAFESLLIPMIIMIALWGSKNNRQANNYLIFYTMVSAIPMLLAILLLYYSFGTTNILFLNNLVLHNKTCTFLVEAVIWLSFFFAFAVKTPMVPFHIWLPKTHVDAPTVGSVILAGVLLKVGLIGMIRFLIPLFPEVTHFFAPYVSAVATIGVIYSSLITLRQIDMKRIIAYSSVAHMNMALVSLCSLNLIGLYSTIYLMVSHGLIASGLFFLVGFLYNRFHVRSIYYYSGLVMCMPFLAVFFFLFTLANMAFPLTSGFIGEFLLLLSISMNNFYLGFLNALSLLLTTVYSILLFGRVFLGELKPWLEKIVFNYIWDLYLNTATNNTFKKVKQLDLMYSEMFIAGILFMGIIFLGIYPQWLFNVLDQSLFQKLSFTFNA